MNILQANVKNTATWWQCELLQLDVVVEATSEERMLEELEHRLIAEFHLAKRAKRTPFVNLLRARDGEKGKSWDNDNKRAKRLNLPEEVRCALAIISHMPTTEAIQVPLPSPSIAA